MKYALTAAIALGVLATSTAHGQIWIGQIAGEVVANAQAAAREAQCMRGEAPVPSERRMTSLRDGMNATMARYLALAAASESSDLSTVFSRRRSRSWERLLDAAPTNDVDAINDPLAPQQAHASASRSRSFKAATV